MSIHLSTDSSSNIEIGIGIMIKERRRMSYQLNLKGWWNFTLDLLSEWFNRVKQHVKRNDG